MKREKIGAYYFRSGPNKTSKRKANIYLINGFAYAKDKATAHSQIKNLEGELSEYVRVNWGGFFYQISDYTDKDKHQLYKPSKPINFFKN